jgi:twinkle protein
MKGPCPKCGSSDALEDKYPTGPYCHSCSTKFFKDSGPKYLNPADYTIQQVSYRSHAVSTLKKYGVTLKVSTATGDILEAIYPYPNEGIKTRNMVAKTFSWPSHKGPALFGMDKFSGGSAMAVTVTEGEEDTLASYEMLGSKYPVVSIQSSGTAAKDCIANKEWLESFEKIYLCFDNDEQGRKAETAVAALFPYQKIYIVKKTKFKDANDYLINGCAEEYRKLWFNARRMEADNLISSFEGVRAELSLPKKKSICTFPFKNLQDALYGIRTGETYLFKALEGIGKTELLGAIEYHAAKTTDVPLGIIHLEEPVKRSVDRFVNYEIKEPVHLEGVNEHLTIEDKLKIFSEVAKRDERISFYKRGKSDTSTDHFLAAVRFMVAAAGCKMVFFDHITRLATAFRLDDERKELDYVSTKLSELAEELDFALLMITHVNDDGKTRGSRNISKEAWNVVSLSRDLTADDPITRNTTSLTVEKNRHGSTTGPAGALYFDPLTFMLSDEKPLNLPPLTAVA